MGINYTDEQLQVINLRNRNILVSAAAGSGKTAVLVERILTRLTEEESPIDIDQLLVMTYTEAAAAEMKERIRNAIEEALEKKPEDEHLQRQSTLIHQAQVTTIHGFCLSVIKEYFHTIDLDPGYRVGDNNEIELLKKDVLEEVLEDCYAKGEGTFLDFVECYSSGNSDRSIRDMVDELYKYSRSYPAPEEWLDECVAKYDFANPEDLEQSSFVQAMLDEIQKVLPEIEKDVQLCLECCSETDGPVKYLPMIKKDAQNVQRLLASSSFAELQQVFSELSWERLNGSHNDEVSDTKIALVKGLRDNYKGILNDAAGQLFFTTLEQMQQDMLLAKRNMQVLVDLVKEYSKAFQEKKRSKNIIDFSDMEHYAIEILTRKENGKLVPSDVAREYQEKFEEVMIDEYQDSNFVQETILTSVSSVSKGKHNVFMVGDVKQSIYRFRLSRPTLFMGKYKTYSAGDSLEQRIDLHKNFRSRREVLDAANYVFEQIMTDGLGGISYDKDVALHVGAEYEDMPDNETEVCYVDVSELPKDMTERQMEAKAIAKKIKGLVGHHEILDKKKKTYRKVRYSDIVILCRTLKGWADVFTSTLIEEGIPAYSISKEGYFQTKEIGMMLDYLKILDNPRQDIPFVSTLRSPFLGLSSEELAIIHNEGIGNCFYEKTCDYAEASEEGLLKNRLLNFLRQFEKLRDMVPYTSIFSMVWKILEETGYADYVAALPGGEQRLANIEMLVEKAISFESTSYKGLFHFVRYVEQMEKYNFDQGEASIMDENADVVRIISIHKSKGLEFPIVFVAGMSKRFNQQDASGNIVIHPDLGVGMNAVDINSRTTTPTLLKNFISREINKENVAEELRVLYVAMTRAKEKMILIGTKNKLQDYFINCLSLKDHAPVELPYTRLLNAKTYFDWVTPVVYRNQAMADVLQDYDIEVPFQNSVYFRDVPIKAEVITLSDIISDKMDEMVEQTITKEVLKNWDVDVTYDQDTKKQLEDQMVFSYPYGTEQKTKQKISVSELKKRAYLEEDEIEEEVVIPLLPKFLQAEAAISGAARGTVYHKVMELLDFAKEYDIEKIKEDINKMVKNEQMTEEMAACINAKDIQGFLLSSVGKRVQEAYRKGKFHAEQPFVLGDEELSGEVTLVQGIIDVYFEEEGELVVLDYKTDRVQRVEELKERYQVQLDYYAKALGQITGKPVKEKIIYSFTLGEEIEV